MVFEFLRLQTLKTFRSEAFSRNIIGGVVVGFLVFIFFVNLLILAFALPHILKNSLGIEDPVAFLNTHLLYFFIAELLIRFFFQKLPVIELEKFLHLPIRTSSIIHFLLVKSLFSPLSLIALICFGPFAYTVFNGAEMLRWLGVILSVSLSLHWVILWYKQRFGDHLVGTLLFIIITFITLGAHYYGYFETGSLTEPFFEWARISFLPLIFSSVTCILCYTLAFRFYKKHAYVEELGDKTSRRIINHSFGFLNRFGMAGEIADLEWKLILRHKKSRTYLIFTILLLLYGLLFYNDPAFKTEQGFSYLYIFVGTFITASFMVQYGQLFLSWNSAGFDFYFSKADGLKALINGKYLLFFIISTMCLFLTIPYVYFGWEVLLVHLVTFLFNMGVSIHLVIYMSLWKPKPMDLDKGGMFNYEGMGIAQFLMAIPLLILPYIVFIPFALLFGDYIGLAALGCTGILGLIFHERLSKVSANKLVENKHQISATFRQEL